MPSHRGVYDQHPQTKENGIWLDIQGEIVGLATKDFPVSDDPVDLGNQITAIIEKQAEVEKSSVDPALAISDNNPAVKVENGKVLVKRVGVKITMKSAKPPVVGEILCFNPEAGLEKS